METYKDYLEILKSVPELHKFTTNWLKVRKTKNLDIDVPSVFLTKYMDVDISDEINAFANILNQEGCITFQGKKDVIFYNLKDSKNIDNLYEHLKQLISNYKKYSNDYKGVLYLEISDLQNTDEDKKINDLLEFVNDNKNNIYFIFAYTKKNSKDNSHELVQKVLDKFYVHKIEIEPPTKTVLCNFISDYLTENKFKVSKNNLEYIDCVVDKYFMKNLNDTIYKYPQFIEEINYYLLLNNSSTCISMDILKSAIENNATLKSISKEKQAAKKQSRIGFCIEGR